MSALEFDLEASTACRGNDADFYARMYRMLGRRQLMPLPPMQISSDAMRNYGPRSLLRHIRPLLREGNTPASNLAMIAWYRHCNHEGWKRVERIAVHAIVHPDARYFDVKPVTNPKVNEYDLTELEAADEAMGMFQAAAYPITQAERADHPITRVLEIPTYHGYVALRGIETMMDAQHLYR